MDQKRQILSSCTIRHLRVCSSCTIRRLRGRGGAEACTAFLLRGHFVFNAVRPQWHRTAEKSGLVDI